MERNVQMKGRRLTISLVVASILAGVFSGCSYTGADAFLKDSHTYDLDIFDGNYDRELYCIGSDKEDICIIDDESVFDANYISSAAGILFNIDTNEVVYSKHGQERMPIASLTKIMTSLLVLESGTLADEVELGDEVVITYSDAWLCHFQPGDRMTMRDLLYATLIFSGNDAAAAMAAHVSGSVEAFVEKMNARLEPLDAINSHFANPHGLDASGHYSSLYDLYLAFLACMRYDAFMDVIGTDKYTFTYTHADGSETTRTFSNTNWYFTGDAQIPEGFTLYGGKTGNTVRAHRCLMILVKGPNGDRYIAGILGAEDQNVLYNEMNRLLELARE